MAKKEFKSKMWGGDTTDGLANKYKFYIDIYSVTMKKSVKFKAFLTQFQDQFDTSYDDEYFGGNIEPAKKMTSVVRRINLGWDLVAVNTTDAKNNLARASSLIQMLYPLREKQYDDATKTTQYFAKSGGTPLFKVRFLNLIGHPNMAWGEAWKTGLLGYLDNVSYDVQIEPGFFRDGTNIYPQYIKFSCTFWPQNITPPSSLSPDGFNISDFPYQLDPHFSSDRSGKKGSSGKNKKSKQKTMKRRLKNKAKSKIGMPG